MLLKTCTLTLTSVAGVSALTIPRVFTGHLAEQLHMLPVSQTDFYPETEATYSENEASYMTNAYETDAYETETYETETYETDAYETETYKTETYETDAYETETYETGAYETGAYETGAYETDTFSDILETETFTLASQTDDFDFFPTDTAYSDSFQDLYATVTWTIEDSSETYSTDGFFESDPEAVVSEQADHVITVVVDPGDVEGVESIEWDILFASEAGSSVQDAPEPQVSSVY